MASNRWPKWRQAMANPPSRKVKMRAKFEPVSSRHKTSYLDRVTSPQFWRECLDAYMRRILVRKMLADWDRRTGDEQVMPRLVKDTYQGRNRGARGSQDIFDRSTRTDRDVYSDRGQDEDGSDVGQSMYNPRDFERAFKDLRTRLFKRDVSVQSAGGAVVKMGSMRDLLSPEMNLTNYMPTRSTGNTRSELTSLWYAVEFGTGMDAGYDPYEGERSNTYIRHEGPTKDTSGKYPGSWWLGPKEGQGAHFRGQAGVHFLHEARNRQPKEKWISFIERTLPVFIEKYIKEEAGGSFKRA